MRLIDMGIIDRINARADLTTHARHVVLAKEDYARLLGIARAVEAEESARRRSSDAALDARSPLDRAAFAARSIVRQRVADALVEDSIDDLDAALAGEGE